MEQNRYGLKTLLVKVWKYDIRISDSLSDGYQKIKDLLDEISPFLDQDYDDTKGFVQAAANITLRFQQLHLCNQWHIQQSKSQSTLSEEISKYLLDGEGCRFLRSLIRKAGGSTCILQELIHEDDLQHNSGQYCEPLVDFMINSHTEENLTQTLIDKDDPNRLERVLNYVLFASGFKGSSLALTTRNQQNHWSNSSRIIKSIPTSTLDGKLSKLRVFKGSGLALTTRNQQNHWSNSSRIIKSIPTSTLDGKLSKLIGPLIASKASITSKHVAKNSPLIKAAAFLYLPKVTKILMDHFDVTELGEKGRNIIELSIQALCLDQCDYKSINKFVNLILDTQTIKIQSRYFVIDLQCFQTKHLEIRCNTLHESVCKDTFKAKSRILLEMLEEVTKRKLIDENIVHYFVFRIIEMFPTFEAAEVSYEYGRVLGALFDLDDFDVNKKYSVESHDHPSVFSLLVEMRSTNSNFPYQVLVEHSSFDPGPDYIHHIIHAIGHRTGDTPKCQALLRFLEILLKHPRIDLTWVDENKNTSIDFCVSLEKRIPSIYIVPLLRILSEHKAAPEKEIYKVISRFANMPESNQPEGYLEIYKNAVKALTEGKFDINYQESESKSTVVHVAVSCENIFMTNLLVRHKNFNPNIQDIKGNTAIFLSLRKFRSADDIVPIIKAVKPNLNLDIRNEADQDIWDICEDEEFVNKNVRNKIENILERRLDAFTAEEEGDGKVTSARPVDLVRRPVKRQKLDHKTVVELIKLPIDRLNVVKSTDEQIEKIIKDNEDVDMGVYNMTKASKGKACVIAINKFDRMDDLDGYLEDSINLNKLWQGIGFDVYSPKKKDGYHRWTSLEIEASVKKFAEILDKDDDCAVLCILTHGGYQFLYGSDGEIVAIPTLLKYLNNEKCPQMSSKPKLVIIQACSGRRRDGGVPVVIAAGEQSVVASAPAVELLPTVSDMIVLYPSQPGFVAYVYKTVGNDGVLDEEPKKGSVLVNELIEIFRNYAATEDINTLFTRVNNSVSGRTFSEEDEVKRQYQDCKQMPKYESSLRQKLYLFPRQDAVPVTTMETD